MDTIELEEIQTYLICQKTSHRVSVKNVSDQPQ